MVQLIIAILLLIGALYILFRGITKKIRNKFEKKDQIEFRNSQNSNTEPEENIHEEQTPEEQLSFIKNLRRPNPNNERIQIHTKKQAYTQTSQNSFLANNGVATATIFDDTTHHNYFEQTHHHNFEQDNPIKHTVPDHHSTSNSDGYSGIDCNGSDGASCSAD